MSADNWAICPKCWQEVIDEADAELEAVMNTYGSAPPHEFTANLAAAQNKVDFATKEYPQLIASHRLREDYTIGIDEDGFFRIHYHGKCDRCGLEKKFDHEEVVYDGR